MRIISTLNEYGMISSVRLWTTITTCIDLRRDLLLLADVFEILRSISMKHYGLDPANYFPLPGMSCDALLKKATIELVLLSDINLLEFLERGLGGGISMVC